MVLASKDGVDHPIKEDKKELKPTVTLIGTSNTNGIDPTRFTRKVSLTKEVPNEQSKKVNPDKLATYGTQDDKKKKKHNTICVTYHYAQTNINNVNKT